MGAAEGDDSAPSAPSGDAHAARTVVLIGKTGGGKSTTGNALLNGGGATTAAAGAPPPPFEARRSLASVTAECAMAEGRAAGDGRPVAVVDTPGTCDSGALLETNLSAIASFVTGRCAAGVHALVLVISAADRFTRDEKIAVDRLVGTLGRALLEDHGLVLFTHADDLDGMPLQEFLAGAPDTLKELLDAVKGRVVLWENRPRDQAQFGRQAKELLDAVDALGAPHPVASVEAAVTSARENPAHAALAALDRVREMLSSQAAMAHPEAGAAMLAAFSDIQRQFMPQAGLAPAPLPEPVVTRRAPQGAAARPKRPAEAHTLLALAKAGAVRLSGGDDGLRGVPAGGDSLGSVNLAAGGSLSLEGKVQFKAAGALRVGCAPGAPQTPAAEQRIRVDGRVIADGPFRMRVAQGVVTLHSPLYVRGPVTLKSAGPVGDDDWLGEEGGVGVNEGVEASVGVYRHGLVAQPGEGGSASDAVVNVRYIAVGGEPGFELAVPAGKTFELHGGSLTVQGEVSWDGEGGGLQVEGALDAYSCTVSVQAAPLTVDRRETDCEAWPWDR